MHSIIHGHLHKACQIIFPVLFQSVTTYKKANCWHHPQTLELEGGSQKLTIYLLSTTTTPSEFLGSPNLKKWIRTFLHIEAAFQVGSWERSISSCSEDRGLNASPETPGLWEADATSNLHKVWLEKMPVWLLTKSRAPTGKIWLQAGSWI